MVTLKINGKSHQIDVTSDMPVLWVLRDVLGMTGTRFGCGMALCGACTVQLDGHAIRSCVTPVSAAAGNAITTIEAIGTTPARQEGAAGVQPPGDQLPRHAARRSFSRRCVRSAKTRQMQGASMTTNSISHEEARDQVDTSMLAWRVHEFGRSERMQFERVPVPSPGPGEVLVKVHAAGVGPWDSWIRGGRSVLPQPLPLTLGSDLSGEIEAVGPDVTGLRVGDQVYGVTNPRFIGAYAEYALASSAMIARKPASLSYIEAASVPVIAVTAWQGLFDQAQLTAGQTVLIHGAAGNVGAYAVQIARRAGIRSIATAATDDLAYVRGLGADTVVDFQTERFEDAARDVDAVLDLVGGETQNRSFQVLRRGGKLISAVSQPDQELAKSHGVDATFFLVKVTTRHLTELADLIDRGNLRTRVGTILPLADAREAHFILEGQRPRPKGKIVLAVETQ